MTPAVDSAIVPCVSGNGAADPEGIPNDSLEREDRTLAEHALEPATILGRRNRDVAPSGLRMWDSRTPLPLFCMWESGGNRKRGAGETLHDALVAHTVSLEAGPEGIPK